MKKLGLFFVLLTVISCAKEELTEETALIIGDAIITDEKVFFPVFLEWSKIYSRMEASGIREPLKKGDRIWVELTKINKTRAWAPSAKFLRIIRRKHRITTYVKTKEDVHILFLLTKKPPESANVYVLLGSRLEDIFLIV